MRACVCVRARVCVCISCVNGYTSFLSPSQSACMCVRVCVCVCVCVSIYDLYMSICMCNVYASLCISFDLKKHIGTMHGKYNHPICVDNTTLVLF